MRKVTVKSRKAVTCYRAFHWSSHCIHLTALVAGFERIYMASAGVLLLFMFVDAVVAEGEDTE